MTVRDDSPPVSRLRLAIKPRPLVRLLQLMSPGSIISETNQCNDALFELYLHPPASVSSMTPISPRLEEERFFFQRATKRSSSSRGETGDKSDIEDRESSASHTFCIGRAICDSPGLEVCRSLCVRRRCCNQPVVSF